MSRLYGRLTSDRRKTDSTAGANVNIGGKFTWGSANNPQMLCDISASWYKGSRYPILWIDVPDDIKIIVNQGGEQVFTHLDR